MGGRVGQDEGEEEVWLQLLGVSVVHEFVLGGISFSSHPPPSNRRSAELFLSCLFSFLSFSFLPTGVGQGGFPGTLSESPRVGAWIGSSPFPCL